MAWIALLIFLLLAPMATYALVGAFSTPGAIGQLLAGTGGFVLVVLFLILGGSKLVGWLLVGACVIGLLSTFVATAWLVRDDRDVGLGGPAHDETQALFAGMEWPLFVAALPIALSMALMGTIS